MLKDAEIPEGKPKNKAHFMVKDVLFYLDELSVAAGYDPLPSYYEAAWQLLFTKITNDPMHFQDNNLYINDDGSVDMH